MVQASIEWVVIRSAYDNRETGAIGFIGDKAVVAVSLYDDADWNEDGKISTLERFGRFVPAVGSLFFKAGRAVTQVAMAARGDPDVVLRDPSFSQEAAKQFLDFATGLVFTGLYTVYFSRAVKSLATQTAKAMTNNVVKQYVIRKGMERLAKEAYDSAMRAGTAIR